jgi:hypothetical protein
MILVTPMESDQADEFTLEPAVFPQNAEVHIPDDSIAEEQLEVTVIFTDTPGTTAALKMAECLADRLKAHIRLLVLYEVPYALPLAKPAVPVEFIEEQIRIVARRTRLDVLAQIFLCRDKRRTLPFFLRSASIVVLGGKKYWWPSATQRLARSVQSSGHHVIFAEVR